jgi:hypothetical protein
MTSIPDAFTGSKLDDLICRFVQGFMHLPLQRSSEWLAEKSKGVGGSELAIVDGCNPYQKIPDMVLGKIGLKPFESQAACNWGTLFEDVVTRYIEIDLDTTVRGTDIWIPGFKRHHVSPDGICRVTCELRQNRYTNEYVTVLKSKQPHGVNEIIYEDTDVLATCDMASLVEFKCPYRRKPTGIIPKYYVPQILAGLVVAPMTTRGLFVDAAFRKTSIETLTFDRRYDSKYHVEQNNWGQPLALGIIGFTATDTEWIRNLIIEYISLRNFSYEDEIYDPLPNTVTPDEIRITQKVDLVSTHLPIDLGSCPREFFDRFLAKFAEKEVGVMFNDPCLVCDRFTSPNQLGSLARNRAEIDRMQVDVWSSNDEAELVAVLPWKLFQIYYVQLPRNDKFIADLEPKVASIMEIVDEIRAVGGLPERAKKFRQHFPNTKIPSFPDI